MDKRTTGIVATLAAVTLCGLPGICITFFGLISPVAVAGGMETGEAIMVAAASICLGLIGILIPVGVGFFTIRKRPPYKAKYDEPIPPPF
jgi:hypothetical protein